MAEGSTQTTRQTAVVTAHREAWHTSVFHCLLSLDPLKRPKSASSRASRKRCSLSARKRPSVLAVRLAWKSESCEMAASSSRSLMRLPSRWCGVTAGFAVSVLPRPLPMAAPGERGGGLRVGGSRRDSGCEITGVADGERDTSASAGG
eukprot:scaffold39792_cov32-Tisochrysis_lutea.AAC.1